LFEGGMHWLGGSKKDSDLNRLWRYVGALDDSVEIHYREPFIEFNHEGTPIRLYRDVDKTEKELLGLSPADKKEIKTFCNNIRKMSGLSMPIQDLPGVKVTKRNKPSLAFLFRAIKALIVIKQYSKISNEDYAKRFTHKAIQELFKSLPGDNQAIFMLFLTLGSLASGDGGFPEGGSLPFVERMVKTFEAHGGKLLLNTHAKKIVMENGKAVAVITDKQRLETDAVIIASDTMKMETLFENPPKAAWFDEMQKKTNPTSAIFVSLGINADLRKYPE
jgi:phytoene dehydrogenase-like protein